jgi:hypothetical protein
MGSVSSLLLPFNRNAERWFHFRWIAVAISIGASLLSFLAMSASKRFHSGIAAAIGPAVVIPWSLVLLIFWFHPTQGRLYNGWIIRRMPRLVQDACRGYAAIVLLFFLFVGALVWPALVMINS